MTTTDMLRSSSQAMSRDLTPDVAAVAACIDACLACAQACTTCASACLGEEMVDQLRDCIALDLDCADLSQAAARILSRQGGASTDASRLLLEACAAACEACAKECESHASMHEHCRICAESCRRCERACRDLLAS